jgi:hypothetical protein
MAPNLIWLLRSMALLLMAFSLEPFARTQDGFEHWTVQDGLPQDIVRGISQTPDGYLWIATLDGLVRFDGVRFTNGDHLSRNLGFTSSGHIVTIAVTRSYEDRQISVQVDDIDDLFPEELRINFYRIVQEGLNNVVKHAEATEVDVRIQRRDERTVLTIQDKDRGFGGRVTQRGQSGFGLTGMAERANLLGGELQVQSAPGQGTVMTVVITKGRREYHVQ